MNSLRVAGRLAALLLTLAALAAVAGTASANGGGGHGDRSQASDRDRGSDKGRSHEGGSDREQSKSDHKSRGGDDDDREKSDAKSRDDSCSNPCAGRESEGKSHKSHKSHESRGGDDNDRKSNDKADHESKRTTSGLIAYCHKDANGEWKLDYTTAEKLKEKLESEDVIAQPFQVKGEWHSKRWNGEGQAIFDKCKKKHEGARSDNGRKERSEKSKHERQASAKTSSSHKLTICHATGSSSNPFVVITPSISGVFHGHLGHQGGEDIIPPFTYKGTTYSQNWDTAGQAMFANGCAAAVTATVVATQAPAAPAPAAPAPAAPAPAAPAPAAPAPAQAAPAVKQAQVPVTGAVLGAVSPAAATPQNESAGGVLGAVASAPKAVAQTAGGGTLPFTGVPLWIAALIGGALLASGLVLRRSTT